MKTSKGHRALLEVVGRETQEGVARAVGVKQQSVSAWVRGECAPRGVNARKLEKLYGISQDWWDESDEATPAMAA